MDGNYKKWLDRINAKQNVLSEDNVGQFMDSELATKSAPTSGDTVLGRDSLTGKAVKIPTDQFGGGDTSNLVPYTGANKDINIGAHYFETSQGFKKTDGTANQALTANGDTFDLNTKLDKGTYTGTAQDLKDEIDSKANTSHTHGISDINNLQTSLNNKQGILQSVTGNTGVGKTDASATEKLDVNGNVKATQIKDTYGTLKAQRSITITGNTTLSETHNGAILHVTNTCNITIPTGLDSNFQCVVYAKGAIIVNFVNGGVTINSPSGLLLKTDKMASLFASASNTFNLLGELATS